MKLVPVKVPHTDNPAFAKVDDEDYALVMQHKWYLASSGQAQTTFSIPKISVSMHRLIMGEPEGLCVDHKFHNRLDNRKKYLRVCTHAENTKNRRIGKNNTTGYKGIFRNDVSWYAKVMSDGKTYLSKACGSVIEAALAYNNLALEHHKNFACLNTFDGYTGEIEVDETPSIDKEAYFNLHSDRLTLKSPLEAIFSKEIGRKVREAIKKLTYREKEVICLRYGIADGFIYSLREIGEIFEVTCERTRQVEKRALEKLGFWLKECV